MRTTVLIVLMVSSLPLGCDFEILIPLVYSEIYPAALSAVVVVVRDVHEKRGVYQAIYLKTYLRVNKKQLFCVLTGEVGLSLQP